MNDLLERCRAGEPLPFPAIDMHGHLGRYGYPIPDTSPGSIVDVMDRIGVGQIVCSHMQCMGKDTQAGNDEVLEAMQAFPDRILGYASLFPSTPDAVEDCVRRRLREGFRGIKIHNANGFRYDDPAYEPGLAIAHECRLPVLLHTWGTAADFETAARLARTYPGLSLILAHAGSANPGAYAAIGHSLDNVYLDLTLSRCPRGFVAWLASEAGPEKVVWGSDCCFFSMTQQIGKVLTADLDDSVKRMILADNAERILSRIRRQEL